MVNEIKGYTQCQPLQNLELHSIIEFNQELNLEFNHCIWLKHSMLNPHVITFADWNLKIWKSVKKDKDFVEKFGRFLKKRRNVFFQNCTVEFSLHCEAKWIAKFFSLIFSANAPHPPSYKRKRITLYLWRVLIWLNDLFWYVPLQQTFDSYHPT